jgi:hypothetical protein
MTLKSFGVPVTLGAGVAAAQTYLLDTRPEAAAVGAPRGEPRPAESTR